MFGKNKTERSSTGWSRHRRVTVDDIDLPDSKIWENRVSIRLRAVQLDQLEARTAELADDNAQLRQQAARLEAESQELTETLTAAREMNRDLMNQVNRPPRTPATQSPPVAKRHRS